MIVPSACGAVPAPSTTSPQQRSRTSPSVTAAIRASTAETTAPATLTWTYEVVPAHALPVIDLRVSLRSRCLGPGCLRWLQRWMRYRRSVGLCFGLGMLLVPAALVTGPRVGSILGTGAVLCMLPGTLASVGAFRFDLVRLLLGTFDLWFFGAITIVTFGVLAGELRDPRGTIAVATTIGLVPNVFSDANLRAVRQIIGLSAIGVGASIVLIALIQLQLVPDRQSFAVLQYQSHTLPSTAVVLNGLVTITMLMIRNILRRRRAIRHQTQACAMECVSYRCTLRFRVSCPQSFLLPVAVCVPDRPEMHVQTMRRVKTLPLIDARRTIAPFPFRQLRPLPVSALLMLHGLGLTAFILSLTAYPLDRRRRQQQPQLQIPSTEPRDLATFQIVALVLTTSYCGTFVALYQRQLLLSLVTSFDFLYLSVQLTIIHWSVCDFFDWRPTTLMALVSWMWVHWVLCMDAVTPPVRSILRLPLRAPAVVFTAFVVAGLVVMWVLIVELAEDEITDRVLWSGELWGRSWAFRVMPIFYNCVATILPTAIRLLTRLWTYDRDVLILLDGPVAYDNYFKRARRPPRSPTLRQLTARVRNLRPRCHSRRQHPMTAQL